MAYGIGFVGAHRTGKSFLADKVSVSIGIPFVKSDVSGVFKSNNLDPSKVYDAETTIFIQKKILEVHNEMWDNQISYFITDRTPMDMLGYMMCNMPQNLINDKVDTELQEYANMCFESTKKYFHVLIEVLPGIPVVEDMLKASTHKSHINHVSYVMNGALNELKECSNAPSVITIPRGMTDIVSRVDYSSMYIRDRVCV